MEVHSDPDYIIGRLFPASQRVGGRVMGIEEQINDKHKVIFFDIDTDLFTLNDIQNNYIEFAQNDELRKLIGVITNDSTNFVHSVKSIHNKPFFVKDLSVLRVLFNNNLLPDLSVK